MKSKLREYRRRLSRLWQRAAWALGGLSLVSLIAAVATGGVFPGWLSPTFALAAFATVAFRAIRDAYDGASRAGHLRVTADTIHLRSDLGSRSIRRDEIANVVEWEPHAALFMKDGRVIVLEEVPEDVLETLRIGHEGKAIDLVGAPRAFASVLAAGTLVSTCLLTALPISVGANSDVYVLIPIVFSFVLAAIVAMSGSSTPLRVGVDGVRFGRRFIPIDEIRDVEAHWTKLRLIRTSGKPTDIPLSIERVSQVIAARIREHLKARRSDTSDPSAFERRADESPADWVRRIEQAARMSDYRGPRVTVEMAKAVASDARAPLRVRVAALAGLEGDDVDAVRAQSADPRFEEAAVAALESTQALAEKLAGIE